VLGLNATAGEVLETGNNGRDALSGARASWAALMQPRRLDGLRNCVFDTCQRIAPTQYDPETLDDARSPQYVEKAVL
jgi:hypothetical protein